MTEFVTSLRVTVVPKSFTTQYPDQKRLYFSALITPIVSASVQEAIAVRDMPQLWAWPEWIGLPPRSFPQPIEKNPVPLKMMLGQPGADLVAVEGLQIEPWPDDADGNPQNSLDPTTALQLWQAIMQRAWVNPEKLETISATAARTATRVDSGVTATKETRAIDTVTQALQTGSATLEGLTSKVLNPIAGKLFTARALDLAFPDDAGLRSQLEEYGFLLSRQERLGSTGLSANAQKQRDAAQNAVDTHAKQNGSDPGINSEREFHQIISGFGDHPMLLRALGLVFDFSIPRPDLQDEKGRKILGANLAPKASSPPLSQFVALAGFDVAKANPVAVGDRSFRVAAVKGAAKENQDCTACQISGELFTPVPRSDPTRADSELDALGQFFLGNNFDTVQWDLTAALRAAIREKDFVPPVASATQVAAPATKSSSVDASAPPRPQFIDFTTHGITLFRSPHNPPKDKDDDASPAAVVNKALAQKQPKHSTFQNAWMAEDLVRGYLIEVASCPEGKEDDRSQWSKWMSLTRRHVEYSFIPNRDPSLVNATPPLASAPSPLFAVTEDAPISLALTEGLQPLSGWLIQPVSISSPFSASDFVDFPGLSKKLQDTTNPLSKFLWGKIPAGTQSLLKDVTSQSDAPWTAARAALVGALNQIVAGPNRLPPPTILSTPASDLQALKPAAGRDLVRLNRLFVADGYSAEIQSNPYWQPDCITLTPDECQHLGIPQLGTTREEQQYLTIYARCYLLQTHAGTVVIADVPQVDALQAWQERVLDQLDDFKKQSKPVRIKMFERLPLGPIDAAIKQNTPPDAPYIFGQYVDLEGIVTPFSSEKSNLFLARRARFLTAEEGFGVAGRLVDAPIPRIPPPSSDGSAVFVESVVRIARKAETIGKVNDLGIEDRVSKPDSQDTFVHLRRAVTGEPKEENTPIPSDKFKAWQNGAKLEGLFIQGQGEFALAVDSMDSVHVAGFQAPAKPPGTVELGEIELLFNGPAPDGRSLFSLSGPDTGALPGQLRPVSLALPSTIEIQTLTNPKAAANELTPQARFRAWLRRETDGSIGIVSLVEIAPPTEATVLGFIGSDRLRLDVPEARDGVTVQIHPEKTIVICAEPAPPAPKTPASPGTGDDGFSGSDNSSENEKAQGDGTSHFIRGPWAEQGLRLQVGDRCSVELAPASPTSGLRLVNRITITQHDPKRTLVGYFLADTEIPKRWQDLGALTESIFAFRTLPAALPEGSNGTTPTPENYAVAIDDTTRIVSGPGMPGQLWRYRQGPPPPGVLVKLFLSTDATNSADAAVPVACMEVLNGLEGIITLRPSEHAFDLALPGFSKPFSGRLSLDLENALNKTDGLLAAINQCKTCKAGVQFIQDDVVGALQISTEGYFADGKVSLSTARDLAISITGKPLLPDGSPPGKNDLMQMVISWVTDSAKGVTTSLRLLKLIRPLVRLQIASGAEAATQRVPATVVFRQGAGTFLRPGMNVTLYLETNRLNDPDKLLQPHLQDLVTSGLPLDIEAQETLVVDAPDKTAPVSDRSSAAGNRVLHQWSLFAWPLPGEASAPSADIPTPTLVRGPSDPLATLWVKNGGKPFFNSSAVSGNLVRLVANYDGQKWTPLIRIGNSFTQPPAGAAFPPAVDFLPDQLVVEDAVAHWSGRSLSVGVPGQPGLRPGTTAPFFKVRDILDWPGLIGKLTNSQDPLSKYLWGKLSPETQKLMAHSAPAPSGQQQSALIQGLNEVLRGDSIYEGTRFAGVSLAPETDALRAERPSGNDVIRLNRWLLADGYPMELRRSPETDQPASDPLHLAVRIPNGKCMPLRFGRIYAFRLRPIFLTGDSPATDEFDCSQAILFRPFGDLFASTPSTPDASAPSPGPSRLLPFLRLESIRPPRLGWPSTAQSDDFQKTNRWGTPVDVRLLTAARPGASCHPAIQNRDAPELELHAPETPFRLAEMCGFLDAVFHKLQEKTTDAQNAARGLYELLAIHDEPVPETPVRHGYVPPRLPDTDADRAVLEIRPFGHATSTPLTIQLPSFDADPCNWLKNDHSTHNVTLHVLPDNPPKDSPLHANFEKIQGELQNAQPIGGIRVLLFQKTEVYVLLPPNADCELTFRCAPTEESLRYLALIRLFEELARESAVPPWLVTPQGPLTQLLKGRVDGLLKAWQTACDGFHPLLSPGITARLRHMTSRPARPPAKVSLLIGQRLPGATSALFDGRYRLDRPSTGALLIQAATEITYDDAPESALPRVPLVELERILPRESLAGLKKLSPVPPDASVDKTNDNGRAASTKNFFGFSSDNLRAIVAEDFAISQIKSTTLPPIPQAGGEVEQIRYEHELGDSKHRTVFYRPLAVSRFADFFPQEELTLNPCPGGYARPQSRDDSASVPFSTDDLIDVPALVKKLAARTALARFLWKLLPVRSQQLLSAAKPNPDQLKSVLVDGLNQIIAHNVSIYDEAAFADVKLALQTVALKDSDPIGKELRRLNRLLLEDGFPSELKKYQNPEDEDARVPWDRVEIPATVRPHPPIIKDQTIVYNWEPGWEDSTAAWSASRHGWIFKRTRTAGVRLWLDRPWYSSGSGETLAALCWASTRVRKGEIERYQRTVSRWGLDPVFETAVGEKKNGQITGPDMGVIVRADFTHAEPDSPAELAVPPSATSQASSAVSPKDLPPSPPVAPANGTALPLPTPDPRLGLAVHRPKFHPDERLWYCDVFIRPRRYTPFVYLSVARYQPFSLPECAVSETVRVDPMQIHPPRSLRVEVAVEGTLRLEVALSGLFPANPDEDRRIILCHMERFTGSLSVTNDQNGRQNIPDLGWEPITLPEEEIAPADDQSLASRIYDSVRRDLPGIPLVLEPARAKRESTYRLSLEIAPQPSWGADSILRVAVAEYELYPTAFILTEGRSWAPRLVYADHAELPPAAMRELARYSHSSNSMAARSH